MADNNDYRVRRPTSSIDSYSNDENDSAESIQEVREGNFKDLCNKVLIKPGMIVRFANPSLEAIKLTHKQTGKEQTYKSVLNDGIVVKDANEELSIFTILSNQDGSDELSFSGRFGRAYYSSTLKNCIAANVEKKLPGSSVKILTREEYISYCNESLFFVDYLFSFGDNLGNVFLDANYMTEGKCPKFLIFSIKEPSIYSGDVGLHIIPGNARCTLKPCREVRTVQAVGYSPTPYKDYLEMA